MQNTIGSARRLACLAIGLGLIAAQAVVGQVPQLVPINPRPGTAYNGYANNGPVYQTAGLGTVQVPSAVVPQSTGIPVQNAYNPGVWAPPVYQVAQVPGQVQQVPGPQPGVYVPQNYVAPAAQPYPVWNPYGNQFNTAPTHRWTGQINALYMTRRKSNSFPLLIDGGGMTLVDANQFNFGWEWGFDVALSRKIGAYQNFELRYFQIDPWRARFSTPIAGANAINTSPPSPIFIDGMIDYEYRTSLRSVEANVVSRLTTTDRLRLALGFRYMAVSENLAQLITPSDLLYVVDTNNHLWGMQIAGDGVLVNANRFSVVAWVKAGIFANVSDQSTDLSVGGAPIFANDLHRTVTSFVGETGIMGEYGITQCVSLIGGYQLLWISGVSLAADQIPNTGPILGGLTPLRLDQSDLFYHGAIFGLEFRF